MNTYQSTAVGTRPNVIESNRVLRNTYFLLALTLLFSALTAGVSMALNLPHPGLLLTLAGYFGLLFLTTRFRNSAVGLAMVFALTGFMGYTLGPILNTYLALANGGQIVMSAMAGTGASATTVVAARAGSAGAGSDAGRPRNAESGCTL